MLPTYCQRGISPNPNDEVGGGSFGKVYGCRVERGPPLVVKEVVTNDERAYALVLNEISIQATVASTMSLAPQIVGVEFGSETLAGRSPNDTYRIVKIYQERLGASMYHLIGHLCSGHRLPLNALLQVVGILLARVAEAVKEFDNRRGGNKIMHGDLGPANVLLGIPIPPAHVSSAAIFEMVRTCRICIADYGYAAEYHPILSSRMTARHTRMRYYHRFPAWYDRAFLLFTTAGLCAERLRLPVADILRRLQPDWISLDVFHDAVKTFATPDEWQWGAVWEAYRAAYNLGEGKRLSDRLSHSSSRPSIPEDDVGPAEALLGGHTSGQGPAIQRASPVGPVLVSSDFSEHPFWGRKRPASTDSSGAPWSRFGTFSSGDGA